MTEMLNFKERSFRPLRKDIGFVFQDPAASFNPHLSIGECVAEPLIIHTDLSGPAITAKVEDLLEVPGIGDAKLEALVDLVTV